MKRIETSNMYRLELQANNRSLPAVDARCQQVALSDNKRGGMNSTVEVADWEQQGAD